MTVTNHRHEPRDTPLPEDATEILAGDVVIDLSQGASLQVISESSIPAGEHEHIRSDPVAAMFGTEPDDTVYNCVFLPTPGDRISAPSKTYAYPESRLLRYPVEQASTLDRLQRELYTNALEVLAVTAAELGPEYRDHLHTIVEHAFSTEMARILDEFADAVGIDEFDPPICDFCGCYITEDGQKCAALEDGRCQP